MTPAGSRGLPGSRPRRGRLPSSAPVGGRPVKSADRVRGEPAQSEERQPGSRRRDPSRTRSPVGTGRRSCTARVYPMRADRKRSAVGRGPPQLTLTSPPGARPVPSPGPEARARSRRRAPRPTGDAVPAPSLGERRRRCARHLGERSRLRSRQESTPPPSWRPAPRRKGDRSPMPSARTPGESGAIRATPRASRPTRA